MTPTVGLLHPGQMGTAIARQLRPSPGRLLWCPEGRSETTRQRAGMAGFRPVSLASLASESDIILSLVPPFVAEQTAAAVVAHGFKGLYVEANAIRPQRVRAIASTLREAGARLIDACVIGPPPPADIPTHFLMAGPPDECARLGELFVSETMEARCLGTKIGQASGIKTAQSIIQKLSRVVAALGYALATDYGIRGELTELIHEWPHPASNPDILPTLATRAWRWKAELQDAAQALNEAGLPSEPATSIAWVLDRWKHFKDAPDADVEATLKALRHDGWAGDFGLADE